VAPYPEDTGVISECAGLPWDPVQRKAGEALEEERYLAIRLRRRQGVLFEDGVPARRSAAVTNRFDFEAKRLLEWHREKAGSLAAGVMPCGRFGAHARWLRLAVTIHTVPTGRKRVALEPELLQARPKRLRFQVFCSPGAPIHRARQLRVRVGRLVEQLRGWTEALRLFPASGSASEAPSPAAAGRHKPIELEAQAESPSLLRRWPAAKRCASRHRRITGARQPRRVRIADGTPFAGMTELADVPDSKSGALH
jgi:hypothetical protein